MDESMSWLKVWEVKFEVVTNAGEISTIRSRKNPLQRIIGKFMLVVNNTIKTQHPLIS